MCIRDSICEVFCEELEKAGYYAGIYASESWFNGKLKNVSTSYDKWLANWGDNDDQLESDELKTAYRIHQYTSMYKIGSKRFDRNVVYSYDYPKVIEEAGLNGFKKGSTPSVSYTHLRAHETGRNLVCRLLLEKKKKKKNKKH